MVTATEFDAVTDFIRLCLCSRWDATALSAARACSDRGGVDWDRLVPMLEVEHLTPLFYQTVRGQALVPPAVEQALADAYYAHAYRNAVLFAELEAALHALTRAGIPVIVLKGAALASAVYQHAAVRPLRDLDLLVHPEDAPACLQLLAQLGYTPEGAESRPGAQLAYENEVQVRKLGVVETAVEVHWSLLDAPYYQRVLALDWFWETARPVSVRTASALMFGPEAQLLHLCAHRLLHHSPGYAGQLLWLHDIGELLTCYRDQLDWRSVLEHATRYDLVFPLTHTLLTLKREWRMAFPEEIEAELLHLVPSSKEMQLFDTLTRGRASVGRRFWSDLSQMGGWRRRLGFIAANIFPSRAYMQERYGVRHPFLLPLYYPYRCWLGLRSLLPLRERRASHS